MRTRSLSTLTRLAHLVAQLLAGQAETPLARGELAHVGVRVNAIQPGLIRTGFEETAMTSQAAVVDERSPRRVHDGFGYLT